MNFITKCPGCGSENIESVIENETSYIYCNNCGLRTKLNDQDGGATTTDPGIEYVVPPGSTETDVQLIQNMNELSTQTDEHQRFDGDAQAELQTAIHGETGQTGSGNGKPRKYKRKQRKHRKHYKKRTHICRSKSTRRRRKQKRLRGGNKRKNRRVSRKRVSRKRVSRKRVLRKRVSLSRKRKSLSRKRKSKS